MINFQDFLSCILYDINVILIQEANQDVKLRIKMYRLQTIVTLRGCYTNDF